MSINRITFTENSVKAFDGRTKLQEVDTSALSGKAYAQFVETVETKLTEHAWIPESSSLWRRGDEGDVLDNINFIEKAVKKLSSGKVVEIKAKGKDKKAKKPKAEKSDTPKDKKKMKILKEQRKRRTLRTKFEDALDDFVIDMIKSRRTLIYDNLVKVAKENGVVIKGMDNGHCKMNVQNSLRARYLREEVVFVNGVEMKISKAELKKHLDAAENGEEEEAA